MKKLNKGLITCSWLPIYSSWKWPKLTHNYFILQYVYYSPLHVSSNVVFIIRRSNCTHTESGIVTLRKVSGLKLLKYNFLCIVWWIISEFCCYLL